MFSENERNIFTFHDGYRERRADPLAIRRALLRASGGKFNRWISESIEPDDLPEDGTPEATSLGPTDLAMYEAKLLQSLDRQEQCLVAIRVAFGLPGLEETAATRKVHPLSIPPEFLQGEGGSITPMVTSPSPPPQPNHHIFSEATCWRVWNEFWEWQEKNESPGAS